MPVVAVAGVIALFLVIIIAVAVSVVVCRRRSTSSKAAAAAATVGGGVSSASAASSALLAGQRSSCVATSPHQLDKRQLHHQYAELRERPAGIITHCSRLSRPSPSPPAAHHQPPTTMTALSGNVGSPFSSYSSMSKTALPVTVVSQPHHQYQPQQAFQLQQQPLPHHLQYYEQC